MQEILVPSGHFIQRCPDRLLCSLSFITDQAVLGANGSLINPTAPVSTEGLCACHISLLDGVPYAANYLSGNVVRFGGENFAVDAIARHEGTGPHPTRQEAAHTHFVRPTPDGKHLFAVDLGIDTIFTYDKDLKRVSHAHVPAGEGCRHLDYSADGRYVYCANELGCSVSVFAYDGVHSKLLETVPTLPADFKKQNTTAAIRVVGDELFVSDRGLDAITVFKRVGSTLVFSYRIPCGGSSPRDFDITPDGRFLICTNEFSDLVTVFEKKNGKYLWKNQQKKPCLKVWFRFAH
jgi:6-phosphogluconolactonase